MLDDTNSFEKSKFKPSASSSSSICICCWKKRLSGIELVYAGEGAKERIEKAAGYNDFLIGAPGYLVLLSEGAEGSGLNAGYIMEDIVLKLRDLGYGSCWLTFTDKSRIKEALGLDTGLDVAAIIAFGLPEQARKRIHLNIFSMSNVSIKDKRQYFEPKKKISELVSIDEYGCKDDLDEQIGFYDDILWESLHAAAASPSYMNRQPYSFLLKDWKLYLLSEADEVTGPIDRGLNLGIAMLHFSSVAKEYQGGSEWKLTKEELPLPAGVTAVAVCEI